MSTGDISFPNETSILIRNFNYDGEGPDAFFYVGTEGEKPVGINEGGIQIHYPEGSKT